MMNMVITVDTRGKDLHRIRNYELVDPQFAEHVKYHVITDVTNPFYGANGASFVYGPQKGASPEEVEQLDLGLENLSMLIKSKKGLDLQAIPGSGAAGGMGGGAVAFLDASIRNGIDTIMEMTGFEEQVSSADLIISGEGKFDHQTMSGKVIFGVSRMAKKYQKPLVIVCGVSEVPNDALNELEIKQVITLVDEVITPEIAKKDAASILERKTREKIKAQIST